MYNAVYIGTQWQLDSKFAQICNLNRVTQFHSSNNGKKPCIVGEIKTTANAASLYLHHCWQPSNKSAANVLGRPCPTGIASKLHKIYKTQNLGIELLVSSDSSGILQDAS